MGKSKELSKLASADTATLQQLGDVMSVGVNDRLTYGRAGTDTDLRMNIDSSVASAAEIEFIRDGVEQGAIEYITNATLADSYLRIKAGSNFGLKLDASGHVTMPYQPAFMAYAGGDVGFSAPQSTWADLNVFNSVNHNRGNHYNSSTCNFTCPVSGVYHFYVNVREETYYGSWGGIHIQLVNNGSRFAETRKWDGYHTEETLTLSVTRQFSANDVVGVRVHSDSSDTNLSVEGGNTTFFGGYLLG